MKVPATLYITERSADTN